jgi:hypothetical protein
MKKCPSCNRTFEDSMRFCQSDGTPLVAADEPIDPYKTMVARPGDLAAAIPPEPATPAPEPETPAAPPMPEEEVLQLPEQKDPLKTMYVSEEEIRREMSGGAKQDEQVMEIPPLTDLPAPEPPKFIEPNLEPPRAAAPPPSPFSADKPVPDLTPPPADQGFQMTTPPIPSPFAEPKKPFAEPPAPSTPSFSEPERPMPASNAFGGSDPTSDWSASSVPAASWSDTPAAQIGKPAAPGQNQTLAIISLVLGIASIVICQLTGPVAIVLGFLARRKASQNPAEYGGAGLALGGMITGVLGTIFLLLAIAYVIFVFGFVATQSF